MARIKDHWANRDLTRDLIDVLRFRLYPELRKFKTFRQKQVVLSTAQSRANKSHDILASLRTAFGLGASLIFMFACFAAPSLMVFMLCLLVPFLILHVYLTIRTRKVVRIELRRLLKEDFWCHECNYLLLGNESGRCPECGEEIPEAQQKLLDARAPTELDATFEQPL